MSELVESYGSSASNSTTSTTDTHDDNTRPIIYNFAPTRSVLPDVEVIYKSAENYLVFQLHSQVLRVSSSFFDTSLSSRWWRDENTIAETATSAIKHRYTLDDEKDLELSILVPTRKGVDELPPIQISADVDVEGMGKLAWLQMCGEAYRNLFRAFYGKRPIIADTSHAHSTTGASVVQVTNSVKVLLDLADKYDCLPVVSPLMESALRLEPKYRKAIIEVPLRSLLIAIKLRSKSLYKEAFINAVGVLSAHGTKAKSEYDVFLSILPDQARLLLDAEIIGIAEREAEALASVFAVALNMTFVPLALKTSMSMLGSNKRDVRTASLRALSRTASEFDAHSKEFKNEFADFTCQMYSHPINRHPRTGEQETIKNDLAKIVALVDPLLVNNLEFTAKYHPYEKTTLLCAQVTEFPWDDGDEEDEGEIVSLKRTSEERENSTRKRGRVEN